ncbi:MAG: hypothetical protein ACLQUS_10115 [Desulfobaccales bacterium]
MKNEIKVDRELVLIPESRLKDFGKKIRDWTRWEGNEKYDIYYSPSSVFFDEYPDFPYVYFLLYDKNIKDVVTIGNPREIKEIPGIGRVNLLKVFEEGMGEWYMDKLYEENECVENFTDYLIKKYREQNLNQKGGTKGPSKTSV